MKSFIDRSVSASERASTNNTMDERNVSSSIPTIIDNRGVVIAQRQLMASIDRTTVPAQLLAEEEMVQGRFDSVQRVEEEEMMQGKFVTIQRAEEEEMIQGKFEPLQKQDNKTGLPDDLKSGMEALSGRSLDHVKVHYNSSKPASVQAHAYAQGADIHLGSGQEMHLPHELGHVVQQMEGRVQPTTQVAGIAVNDNPGLENEATVMGERALQRMVQTNATSRKNSLGQSLLQRVVQLQMDAGEGGKWHIHHDHMKLGKSTDSRVEFNDRSAKAIRKELGEKIERYGLSVTGGLATSFRECIDYINANY